MIRYHLAAVPLVAATATLCLAQDGPTFDCAKAESSAEKLICEDPALAALDRRLAEVFEAAVAVTSGLDAGAQTATDELRAYQRGWIKGRDECWKETDLRSCIETEYLRREGELVAEWMLEEPASVTTYLCGQGPADELIIYLFPNELPGIRVERGDSIGIGAQTSVDTPDTYYLRQMGSVTLNGPEALWEDAYGKATTCTAQG